MRRPMVSLGQSRNQLIDSMQSPKKNQLLKLMLTAFLSIFGSAL